MNTLGGGEQEKSTVTSDKECQVRIYLNELVLFKILFYMFAFLAELSIRLKSVVGRGT